MRANCGLKLQNSPKLPHVHAGFHCNANDRVNREKGYFIKIIPARAGHCTANYNILFSPGMTDFDEFIHKNPT